ncbi:hypothetical protein [Allohahella sp. A8]|uniref:hypothetical protein n=1 Tax=Allohahella sp. A8 TaxID=3141461 RepID=UPI003A80A0D5
MKSLIFGIAVLIGLSGCAKDKVIEVHEAVEPGQHDTAAALRDGPTVPEDMQAYYYKGILSEQGYGLTRGNFREATYWYSSAAYQGHVPAMVALSRVQLLNGFVDDAITWLVLAPRNANRKASDKLPVTSGPVPTTKDYWLTEGEISHLKKLQNSAEKRAIEGTVRLKR